MRYLATVLSVRVPAFAASVAGVECATASDQARHRHILGSARSRIPYRFPRGHEGPRGRAMDAGASRCNHRDPGQAARTRPLLARIKEIENGGLASSTRCSARQAGGGSS
jgi:hypothetical protein